MKLLKALCFRLAFAGSLAVTVLVLGATAAVAAGPVPSGRVAIAWHVTISPSWFGLLARSDASWRAVGGHS